MNKEEYTAAKEATRNKVQIHELINFEKISENPVKVSIVIPVCNTEEYLSECLESAINQTLKDIEIICVNDGSTDSSLEILKKYAEMDSRVKIINKDNAGYGHAMNIGMDMAVGEYIGIIESDDYASLEMYEELYMIAKETEADFVKADFNRFEHDENGDLVLKYNATAKKKEYYNRIINPAYEPFSFRFIMNTWSGIYSREFVVENGIRHQETPGASYQDNGFWFQTMIYAKKMYVVDKPYYMNRRDNPNSSVYSKKKVYCMNEEYSYIYNILCANEELYSRFIGEFHLKRYHNYENNYRRIAEEYKLEYAKAISLEFREALSKGEVDRNLFYSNEIDEYEWIAENPDDYWFQHNADSVKVSVIIPVYNTEDYLKQCIESVLKQTLSEIEVICVDDESDDGSCAILENFAENDPRVKILHQTHSGAGAARNRGLAIARGEYLSFLDSDDFFEPDMLESIYNRCKKNHADVGIYKVRRYDCGSGKYTSDSGSFVEKNIPKKTVFSPKDMSGKIFTTFQTWPWNKIFRRHFVEKEELQFQKIRRTNDMYFVNTALIRANRITALPRELVNYRIGTANNCQSTNHLAPEDFFEALRALYNEVQTKKENARYEASFENLFVRSCMYNLNSLKDADAFRQLYDFLHNEGFTSIKVTEFNPKNILSENKNSYNECLKIYNNSFENYVFKKILYYRNREKENIKAKKVQNISPKDQYISSLEQRMKTVETEITKMKMRQNEIDDYKTQLLLTRASISFKIAQVITFIPRKIRGDKQDYQS